MRYIISSSFASMLAISFATASMADVPTVVTDMPAVTAIVAQVMGDMGAPTGLLDKGASPHSFQLRPSQAQAINDADLIFWIGPELTPWLDRALQGGAADRAVALLHSDGTFTKDFSAEGGHEDHDHGHDHGAEATETDDHAHDHEAETGHDHDHSGTDPHAWLDPANASLWAGVIAAKLSEKDPANALTYQANAKAAQDAIAALDGEIASLLAPVKDRPFVVFHDAYGYFAGHYGLSVAGAVSLGDASAPSAARLSELQARVAEGEVVCLFPEAQHDPALLIQIADATGVKIGAPLDPEGTSYDAGPDAYAQLMRGLATSLADCLMP